MRVPGAAGASLGPPNGDTTKVFVRGQEERWHCGECLSQVRRGTWEGGADRSRHTNEHRCINGQRARRLWSSAKLCKGAACALCKTPNKATK
jgi:hypothetical protein